MNPDTSLFFFSGISARAKNPVLIKETGIKNAFSRPLLHTQMNIYIHLIEACNKGMK